MVGFWFRAGFPALVLAVISRELQPELKFILVEKNKKAGFLLEIVKIGLNVDIFPKMLN